MLEVEVKVRGDHEAVRSRLDEVDAERLGAVRQTDTYYDAPHRDFAATDEALRIRRERPADGGDPHALLTYKGPLVEKASKSREEAETVVGDADAAATVLGSLGFDPAAEVRKERERFSLDGYVVTLDAVEGLGEFVEVEAAAPVEGAAASALETARAGAFDVLRKLDLDPAAQIRTSYLELLLEATPGDDCE